MKRTLLLVLTVLLTLIGTVHAQVAQVAQVAQKAQAPVPADRIVVGVAVEDAGAYLVVHSKLYNPYRCNWRGDYFLEQLPNPSALTSASQAADAEVKTVLRRYNLLVVGGTTVEITAHIERPMDLGAHQFLGMAYRSDGLGKEVFYNCANDTSACPAALDEVGFVPSLEVVELSEVATPSEGLELPPCTSTKGPIDVDLTLSVDPESVDAMAAWGNVTKADWKGDLYVDMTTPFGDVTVARRDVGTLIPAGIGFCTVDSFVRPLELGVYAVAARAQHLEGRGSASWTNAGNTEITAACGSGICELIAPAQEQAKLAVFTGDSWLHVESTFFSEHTSVTMSYGGDTFDITGLCAFEQLPISGGWHTTIAFDSMNLPIGPHTLATYTVNIHPMPIVPPGAKLTDSLKVWTNGPE